MAAIQFPNNPNTGDLFTASNGIRYTYDGEKWKTLGTSTVGTEGQFLETPTSLTIDKVIPANTNTGVVGPMAISAGVTLSIPATSTFRTLLGKSVGIPTSGGTFTGPVNLTDTLTGTFAFFSNNVGIGTSSPIANLHIQSDTSKKLLVNNNDFNQINSAGSSFDIGFGATSGATYTDLRALTNGRSNWGDLVLQRGGGNVGIGKSSPISTLHLRAGNPTITLEDGTGALQSSISGDGGELAYSIAGSEKMRITSGGNVGIGTSTPTEELEVVGTGPTVKIRSTANNTPILALDSNRAANVINSQILGQWDGTSIAAIRFRNADDAVNKDNGDITLLTASAGALVEHMRILNNGNVGIGTSSPDEALSIAKSGNSSIRLGQAGGNYAYRLRANVNSSVNGGFLIEDAVTGSDLYKVTSGSSGIHRFSIDASEKVRIDSSGNVGIGTSSPDVTLHVYSSTISQSWSDNDADLIKLEGAVEGINFVNSTTGFISFSDTDARARGLIEYLHSSDSMQFDTAGSEKMRIASSGNVGIGTTSPDTPLEVSKQVSGEIELARFRIKGQTNNPMLRVFADESQKLLTIGTSGSVSGSQLAFDTSGGEAIRILSTGGITFNGDSATANALDDYEEGIWTPSYGGSTTNPTLTYDIRGGRYVKVGRVVHCEGRLRTDAASGGSGNLQITGLPFTPAPESTVRAGIDIGVASTWSTYRPTEGLVKNNSTIIDLFRATTNSYANITVANLGNTTNDNNIQFSVTYMAAA